MQVLSGKMRHLPKPEVKLLVLSSSSSCHFIIIYLYGLCQYFFLFGSFRYARERITSFLKQLEMVIEQLCAKPDMEIGKVYLVTEEDKPNLPDPSTPLDTTFEGKL